MKWAAVLILLQVAVLRAQTEGLVVPEPEKKPSSADSATAKEASVPVYSVIGNFERRIRDTVYADVVVSRKQFVDWFHSDFGDLLSNLEGVFINDLGSFGRTITASSETGTPRSFLILVDGVPMTDPDAGWTDLNHIPLEHIERIEYYRGAGGSSFGDGAATGYVNIITRTLTDATPLTRVAYRSVFSDFRDIGALFMRPIKQVGFSIGGASKKSPGEQRRFGTFGTPFLQSRYNGKYLFSRLDYAPSSKFLFHYYGLYNKNRFDAYGPERSNGTFETSGSERKDVRWDHRLTGSWLGEKDALDLLVHHTALTKHFSGFTTDRVPQKYTARRLQMDARYRRWIFGGFSSQLGYSRREDRVEKLLTTVNYHKSDDLFAVVEGGFDSFATRAGIRYSHSSVYEDGFAADAMVKKNLPFSSALTLIGGYGYRYPSFLDAIPAADSSDQKLITEKMLTGRVGIVFTDRFGLNRLGFSLSAARATDFIDYVGTGSAGLPADSLIYTFATEGVASVMSAVLHGMKNLDLIGFDNSLLMQVQYRFSDAALALATPKVTVYTRLRSGRRFLNDNIHVRSNITVRYFYDHDGYTFIDAPQTYYRTSRRLGDGFLVNYRLSAEIGAIQFFIEQENILRQQFALLDGYPVTPIRFRMGLLWHFDN